MKLSLVCCPLSHRQVVVAGKEGGVSGASVSLFRALWFVVLCLTGEWLLPVRKEVSLVYLSRREPVSPVMASCSSEPVTAGSSAFTIAEPVIGKNKPTICHEYRFYFSINHCMIVI